MKGPRRLRLAIGALAVLVVTGLVGHELFARVAIHGAGAHGGGDPSSCTTCHGPTGPPGGISPNAMQRLEPWSLAAMPSGRTLLVACTGARRVERFELPSGRRLAPLLTRAAPSGLAVSPDGSRVAVTFEREDRVTLFDAVSLVAMGTAAVGESPAGVAWDATGQRVFVANAGSGDVSVVAAATLTETHRLAAGREPFVVARSPDGATVAVVSRRAELDRPTALPRALLTLIDTAVVRVRAEIELPSCHMSEGAAFTPDGRRVLVPAILVRNRLPIVQVANGWVMSSVVAVVDVASGAVDLVPLTEANRGFADPSGIAVSADGRRAYVASGGLDEVAEIDLVALLEAADGAGAGSLQRLSGTRRYLRRRLAVGSNPRAVLAVAAGGRELVAVSERLDESVRLLGPDGDAQVLELGPDNEGPLLRGARNFHSARFAFQRAFSCRSCHPGGHTDGLTYDFDIDGVGRNVVLNRSLLGVAGTGPFKWAGTNPTLQRQCGPRFAMVLTRADPLDDAELGDLVAYLHSLRAPRPRASSGRVVGVDTEAVERGRRLFERSAMKDGTPIPASGRCITCHPPPHYTSRRPADVGTKGPRDSTGHFDVPHLTGIGRKAPYLHDGRALSLEEIWTLPGVGDRHGVVSDLDKVDLNDLIAFMRGL
jgi:YVTN family beta-propeller protein